MIERANSEMKKVQTKCKVRGCVESGPSRPDLCRDCSHLHGTVYPTPEGIRADEWGETLSPALKTVIAASVLKGSK